MRERTVNLIVGVTALGGLVAMAWLIFIFGEVPAWLTDSYPIRVTMDNAAGLATGSRVKLNGIDVGYVGSVRFLEDITAGVELTCYIEAAHDIPAEAKVTASAGLLGGASHLSIVPVKVEPMRYLPRDGKGRLRGEATSLTQDLSELATDLGADLRRQLDNFGRVSDRIVELSDRYMEVGEQIGALLERRSAADVDAGRADANLVTVIERADARLAEMGEAIEHVNSLLGDPALGEDIRQTAANTRQMTAEAQKLVDDASVRVDQLARQYAAVADDLSRTLAEVNGLLADVRAGEGTLGRLMKDPALYESLTDAANRLNDTLKEAQLLIQKWKAEGLPVQF